MTRTHSSHPGRPVGAAQPIIMPQRADLRGATSSSGSRRNRIATPTRADEIFGKHRAAWLGSAAGQRVAVRFTSSAAATVTAVTTATEGHAPMRLARGCEPPIAARYTAVRRRAPPDARYQSCAPAPREQRAAQVTAARPPCDEEPPGQAEGGDRRRQGRGSAAHGLYAICRCPQASTTGAVPGC